MEIVKREGISAPFKEQTLYHCNKNLPVLASNADDGWILFENGDLWLGSWQLEERFRYDIDDFKTAEEYYDYLEKEEGEGEAVYVFTDNGNFITGCACISLGFADEAEEMAFDIIRGMLGFMDKQISREYGKEGTTTILQTIQLKEAS